MALFWPATGELRPPFPYGFHNSTRRLSCFAFAALGVHGYGPHCGPNRLAQLPAGFNFITANLLLCCVCFCSSIRGTFIRVCLVCAIKRQKSMLLTHWKPFGVREDVICWYLLNSSNFDLLIPSSSQKIIARYFIVRAHILCGSCIVLLRLAFSYS